MSLIINFHPPVPRLVIDTPVLREHTGSDPYEGDYTIIPSTEVQILPTDGKAMLQDLTIEAMPQGQVIVPDSSTEVAPTVSFDPTTGAISVSVNASQIVAPTVTPGYVDSGTAGMITIEGTTSSTIPLGSAVVPNTTIEVSPTLTLNTLTHTVSAAISKTETLAPTVEEGYVTTGIAGNIVVNGSGTLQLPLGTTTIPAEPITVNPVLSFNPSTKVVSALVNGSEQITPTVIEGWISTGTPGPVNIEGTSSITIPSGSAAIPNTTIIVAPSITFDDTTGAVDVSISDSSSISPTITSGYVDSGTSGTITIQGSGTTTIPLGNASVSSATVTTNPTISFDSLTGTVTASVSASESVTPTIVEGYIKTGTSGTLTIQGNASAAVPPGSATTPTTTITANPTISFDSTTGTVSASVSATDNIIPTVSPGWVGSGTAGEVTVQGAATSSISLGSATTPATTITANPSLSINTSTGVVSSTVSATETITPTVVEGYIAAGTSGAVNVQGNAATTIPSGSAETPATTITANPSVSFDSLTGTFTATVNDSQSVAPTVTPGWVSTGTAGTVAVQGTATSTLTTQGAQTIYPLTTDQTIPTDTYLNGAQTFKGVVVSGLMANKIAKGTIVEIGDVDNAARIARVVGTLKEENPEAPDNDVIFFDYDGTIRYSYSAAEFAQLTELPPFPVHAGLVAQEWNWSLADAQTYVAAHGILNIGVSYITDDGKTRIYVLIPDDAASHSAMIRYGQSADNAVTVDWGDGTATQTFTNTAQTSHSHSYATGGIYCISLSTASGATMSFVGSGTTAAGAYNSIYGSRNTDVNTKYRSKIIAVEFGNNVTQVGQSTFWLCYQLRYVTIPTYLTNWGSTGYTFCTCYGLRSITLPRGFTGVLDYMFQYDMTLERISFPKSVTSIGIYAFASCYGMKKITLPESCTTIGTYAFQNLTAMSRFTMSNSLQTLPNYGIYQAFSVGEIALSNGLKTLGQYAMSNMYSLTKLIIPASVTSIQANALTNCYSLIEIHFRGTTPPTIGSSNVWTGIPTSCKIYVPTGYLSTYTSKANMPNSNTFTYIEE